MSIKAHPDAGKAEERTKKLAQAEVNTKRKELANKISPLNQKKTIIKYN